MRKSSPRGLPPREPAPPHQRSRKIAIAAGVTLLVLCAIWGGLRFFGYLPFIYEGDLMNPHLLRGDFVIVAPLGKDEPITKGDLLVFEVGGRIQIRQLAGFPLERIEGSYSELMIGDFGPIYALNLAQEVNDTIFHGERLSSTTIPDGLFLTTSTSGLNFKGNRVNVYRPRSDFSGRVVFRLWTPLSRRPHIF